MRQITQAIDEARQILSEAQQRVAKVGDDAKAQTKDKQLLELTTLMYGRIPKKKDRGAAASASRTSPTRRSSATRRTWCRTTCSCGCWTSILGARSTG